MASFNDEEINQKIFNAESLQSFYNKAKSVYLREEYNTKYIVYHQNIRSIHKNFNTFIASDEISKADVLILTEINCKEEDISKYLIKGFKQVAKPRAVGRGGGILIYYRENYIKIKVEDANFEHAESLKILINNDLELLAIYRPPSSNKILFLKELEKSLKIAEETNKDAIILGDLNINLLDVEDSTVEKYENLMCEYGFARCIFFPTREEFANDRFSSTIIDHIYHKFAKLQNLSTVITKKVSDHYGICAILYSSSIRKKSNYIDKINHKIVKRITENFPWQKFTKSNNEIHPFERVADVLLEIKRSNIERHYVPTSINVQSKNWMTNEIEELIKSRDKLFLKCKRNKSNKQYRKDYSKVRNLVIWKIKLAKDKYYKGVLQSCGGNSTDTWRALNEILGRAVTSIDDNILRYMPNKMSLVEILNEFGEHFSTKVDEMRHRCDFIARRSIPQEIETAQSLYIPPINLVTVKFLISRLKKKSPGLDNVEVSDILNGGDQMATLIEEQINIALKKGEFPKCLKEAIVRPIYKGGSHKDVNNYRPIAILSTIDKIIESYIDLHLTNYLQNFNLIDSRQYAYQKGKGAENVFADLQDYVSGCLSKKEHVIGIFVDFSKAFDLMDHEILLKKLKKIGIQGRFLSFIESYLTDRSFRVKIDGSYSESKNLNAGVPQGSKLGPKLFLIYINELFAHLKNVKIYIFADDVLILYNDENIDTCIGTIQSEVDILNEWAHDNKLNINIKKTVGIHICVKQLRPNNKPVIKLHSHTCLHNFTINCDCNPIKFEPVVKYLGIMIDEDFSWAQQVQKVMNKMRSVIKEVKIAKSRLNKDSLRIIYYSLAYSHLIYGISAWGHANTTQLSNLQEKLLRIMSTKKHLKNPNFDVYKAWRVIPFDLVFEQIILTLKYHEAAQGERRLHSYGTRTALTNPLIEPKSTNKYYERTWSFILPRLWNKLPNELKNLNSKTEIKSKLKEWFMQTLTEN
jgi:Reverse transcriptase (RNA-dependent DNA polymerase)